MQHEKFFVRANDEGTHGGSWRNGFGNGVTLKNLGYGKHVRRHVIRQGFLQLRQGVVSGKNRAGANSSMAGCGDIVFHIAHKEGLFRSQFVFFQDAVDGISFVWDPGVGFPKEMIHAEAPGLVLKIGFVDGAQEKDR